MSRLFGLLAVVLGLTTPAGATEGQAIDLDALAMTAIDGQPLALGTFRGRAVLVVNTASRCGFTPQYAGLQQVWERYRDRGLIVLGIPSNDFGNQEPGSEGEIRHFCEVNFVVDFPMLARQRVRGPDAHPIYRWAARQTGPLGVPRWNFHKLLIGRDGRLVDWFSSTTAPDAARVTGAIERALR